jgi:hypothetical protein
MVTSRQALTAVEKWPLRRDKIEASHLEFMSDNVRFQSGVTLNGDHP